MSEIEKLEDDFIEFWDTHANKLGLGRYSSDITRFWLDKIEQTRKEERDRIVDIAVERAKQWKEKGFEIDTLIDGLKIIKLEDEIKE